MGVLVVPILCILTAFTLAITLYWKREVFIKLLYTPVTDLKDATHVVIKGKPGNMDVCKLQDGSNKIANLINNLTQQRFLHLKDKPYIVSKSCKTLVL
jgi:hypothetical protein